MTNRPLVLTIAGTDPSGGAGIQADLRAFQSLGAVGVSIITAAVAQNSEGVRAIHPLPPRFVATQLDTVAADAPIGAVKIGMLANERIVSVVADRLTRRNLPNVVLDPVLAAKDGRSLLSARGAKRLLSELLPKTLVVTPNVPEASALSGITIASLAGARDAARVLHGLGARFVVIKGGHWAESEPAVDLLYDGVVFSELAGDRIAGIPVRGTGCLFSAAMAVQIAKGRSVPEACAEAKAFVARAIADAVQVGKRYRIWIG